MDEKTIFCTECGAKLRENSRFCVNCGAEISYEKNDEENSFTEESSVKTVKKRPKKKIIVAVVIIVCVVAAALVSLIIIGRREFISIVKSSTYSSYDVTYGEVFDEYFDNPSWEFMVGGMTESLEDADIVEFTGECTYEGDDIDVLIQFRVASDDSVSLVYCAMDDVAKNSEETNLFLNSVFAEYITAEADDTEEEENDSEDQTEADVDDSAEEAEPETESVDASVYEGEWMDTYSQRCHMEISSAENGSFDILIGWADSSDEITYWEMSGEYSSADNGIAYVNGTCYELIYTENGNTVQVDVYSDGEGVISASDGKLYWEDEKEDAGADCVFERNEEDNSGDYLCSFSSDRLITETDMQALEASDYGELPADKSLAQMIINELYAKYGYEFQTEEIQQYFEQKGWYSELYPHVTDMDAVYEAMSDIEKSNIDFLSNWNQ